MPTKPRFSYDAQCEELAEHFLSDETHDHEHVQKLAQTIQDAIEDWLREAEAVGEGDALDLLLRDEFMRRKFNLHGRAL